MLEQTKSAASASRVIAFIVEFVINVSQAHSYFPSRNYYVTVRRRADVIF